MVIVFAFGFSSIRRSEPFGPFVVFGVISMVLMTMTGLVANMFGFDRDGFRVYVLSPIPRRELLLGKNLAPAPFVLGIGFVLITGAAFVVRLRWDHFAAAYLQFFIMYLLYNLLGNVCSIFAPYVIPAGSLKRARPSFTVLLIQLGCVFVAPVLVGLPAILPWIVELSLSGVRGANAVPISLVLSALMFAASLWCYGRILTWEGRLLADREQLILDVVSKKAE
jgi:hypothetical protein